MARTARTRRRDPERTTGYERVVGRSGSGDGLTDSAIVKALLPLRFFAGATFLYAGIDKFLNPSFLREGGNGSIAQQLEGFTRNSPLTPLIQAIALPHPTLIGALIALGEIAVGIGVVAGLAYRFSALAGFLIAMLFFLTASWGTSPYYYGPDLPYAAGFLTLALVGRPGPFTLAEAVDSFFEPVEPVPSRYGQRQPAVASDGYSPERRAFLQAVVVGAAALVVGGAAFVITRAAGDSGLGTVAPGTDNGTGGNGGNAGGTQPSPASGTGATGGTGGSIGTVSQINQQGFLQFTDPTTGDPAYAISPNGQVQGFDATCTHQGCPVQYDAGQKMFFCPCHGAEFDATHGAQVVAGPAPRPLSPIQLRVDSQGNVFVNA